jgi:S-adenosylmethionine decarboxylase
MKKLGRHVLAEFTNCDCASLNDSAKIELWLNEAARKSGATIVKSVFHHYNPHGVSGVVVIAESHISIHTWPEYGYAAVDFFTCGDNVDPFKACDYLTEALCATDVLTREFARGIPSVSDSILPHKPTAVPTSEELVVEVG